MSPRTRRKLGEAADLYLPDLRKDRRGGWQHGKRRMAQIERQKARRAEYLREKEEAKA